MNGSVVCAVALLAGFATIPVEATPVGQARANPSHKELAAVAGPDVCQMERTIAETGGDFVPSTTSLLNPDDMTVRLSLVAEAFAALEGLRTDVTLATGS